MSASVPVQRTNILEAIRQHLPDERAGLAERRAALMTELAALEEYDATLARIELAIQPPSKLTLEKTG